MKYLFLVLLFLVSCSEKPIPVDLPPAEKITVVDKEQEKLEFGKCYRSESNEDDFFIRIDKRYDEITFNVTLIKNLEYRTVIESYDVSDFMEYNCDAFSDMLKTSTPYRNPSPTCIDAALKACIDKEE